MPPDAPIRHYLTLFDHWLNEPMVEEIMINRPGEIFVERTGGRMQCSRADKITYKRLKALANLIASYSDQSVNKCDTLLSACLPDGERVQVVLPPSCEPGKICLSIRKANGADLSLDCLAARGMFNVPARPNETQETNARLNARLEADDIIGFLQDAVLEKKNIVISGGTSSGKTTLANALLKTIPDSERIITIEDVREVKVRQSNAVHLLASKGQQGTAKAGISDLFSACLRLRPDRIILSEIRGREAYDFLNSMTSGHPGSITTIHADSVRYAIERLARYIGDHESGRNIENKETYIRQAVDIIIQVHRLTETGGRGVTDIYFKDS